MTGSTVRPEVGPRQPQVWSVPDRLDVVDVDSRSTTAGRAAFRMPRDEDFPQRSPFAVVSLFGRTGSPLIKQLLPPRLSLLPRRHADRPVSRRCNRHQAMRGLSVGIRAMLAPRKSPLGSPGGLSVAPTVRSHHIEGVTRRGCQLLVQRRVELIGCVDQ